jgi:hypothetical protein
MKKLAILFLSYASAVIFAACGNTQSDRSTQKYSSQVPQQTVSADKPAEESSLSGSQEVLPDDEVQDMKLKLSVNNTGLTATLADSTAARELAEKLKAGPVTVALNEYGGFEKVGRLPWSLTKSDRNIAAEAGDIMLYQGNQMTIFYNPNSWSYTKLGHIDNITGEELADLFGDGNITVTLSY